MFMRAVAILAAVLLAGCAHQEAAQPKARPAVASPDIKSTIVAASIFGYEKPCPCPYSKDGTCGNQSAWSRGGGANPLCYRSEVTAEDVKRWRDLQKRAPERP
jgi:hypothetical protein